MHPGVGEGVNGFGGPLPMKLGQNKDGNQTSHTADQYCKPATTYSNYRSCFRKHVSEDDGLFTLWVESFTRLRIYIYMRKAAKGLSNNVFDNF